MVELAPGIGLNTVARACRASQKDFMTGQTHENPGTNTGRQATADASLSNAHPPSTHTSCHRPGRSLLQLRVFSIVSMKAF